ncbi:M56 family metallopeptidase [Paenibacillus turpanensis]|uniref:M56 family metallopeptidase n=1 Tax=Paenibacillus turpanensis TaxID=2689078 RepID=UPI0014079273|nr:M56 family metallopeptidase [Paenibacillus turpanensis]
MDIVVRMFEWFLYSTLAASAIIVLVLAVQALFRRRLGPRLSHGLWLLVLLRLLFPVFPDSPVSVFQLLPYASDAVRSIGYLISPEEAARSTGPSDFTLIPEVEGLTPIQRPKLQDSDIKLNLSADEYKTENSVTSPPPLVLRISSMVWAAGVLITALLFITTLLLVRARVKRLHRVIDPYVLHMLEDCRKKLGLRQKVQLYTGADERGPYTAGLLRPYIYVPESLCKNDAASELVHILLHELAHIRRKDAIWNAAGFAALALHWMNPLVWFAVNKMKADRELACDACVLEVLHDQDAVSYGYTVIGGLQQFTAKRKQPLANYFLGLHTPHQHKRRIQMIASYKKGAYQLSVSAVIIAAVLGVTTLTNASMDGTARESGGIQAPYTLAAGSSAWENWSDPSSFRVYNNLEKAVQMAEFPFQVPAALPAGYTFAEAQLTPKEFAGERRTQISIRFEKRIDNTIHGYFDLTAWSGSEIPLADALAELEKKEERLSEAKPVLSSEVVSLSGKDALKVTIQKHNSEMLTYLWQHAGVLYQLEGRESLSNSELLALIGAMKSPDDAKIQSYINPSLDYVSLYDSDDLKRNALLFGLEPKFPLLLAGKYKLASASFGGPANFSYPTESAEGISSHVLSTHYQSAAKSPNTADSKDALSFTLLQVKDHTILPKMAADGFASLWRIDGQMFKAPVTRIEVAGTEVFQTHPYKIDGELSPPEESDFISYFWKENEICYQIRFKASDLPVRELIEAVMKEKPIEL